MFPFSEKLTEKAKAKAWVELNGETFKSKDTFPIMGNDTNGNEFASYESAFEEPIFLTTLNC